MKLSFRAIFLYQSSCYLRNHHSRIGMIPVCKFFGISLPKSPSIIYFSNIRHKYYSASANLLKKVNVRMKLI